MSDFINANLTTFVAVAEAEAASPSAPPGHHPSACLNCDTALTGNFCPHCGQPAATHRFTLKHLLLHDLPHSVWHVDKGIIFTFWQMLTRPGLTIRGYLAGQRARYFRPISYLLLLVVASSLIMSNIHVDIFGEKSSTELPELMKLVMERYLKFNFKYPSLPYVFLLPLNALVAWAFLRRAGYYYAELLISGAFISGTLVVIGFVFMLPFMLTGGHITWLSQLSMVPMLLYPFWVNAQLLTARPKLSRAGRYGRAAGIAALQLIVLLIYAFAVMFYFIVQTAREHPELAKKMVSNTKPVPTVPKPPVK